MNGYPGRAPRPGAIVRQGWPIALGLLLALIAAEARACPLRNHRAASALNARQQARQQSWVERRAIVNTMMEDRWQDDFARALRRQRTDIQRPPNLFGMLSAAEDGLLPDTPLVEYLRWRRSRAPRRFDRFHPRLGPILARDELAQLTRRTISALATAPALPALPVGPDIGIGRSLPLPQIPIPEPSTLLIALSLSGAMAWMHRRRSSRASAGPLRRR